MTTETSFPRIALIRQELYSEKVQDVGREVGDQLTALSVERLVQPGMRIAVTAGSRGIADVVPILAGVTAHLKRSGAQPFVVPAMGSHGGASSDGQMSVLKSLGITEASLKCRIVSSLDVVPLGETPEGIPVLLDRSAAEADGIVVVNRVKPHTDFVGEIESGLMKMLAVGLGKHAGALAVHSHGVKLGLETSIVSVARFVLQHCRILFGLGIVENARHQVARVVGVRSERLEEVDRALQREATRLMGHLPCEDLDVLVVDEMGKDISGTGMDTKVIGRIRVTGTAEPATPRITRIVVRRLTDPSHGNALGIGLADFVTQRLVDKVDFRATYVNGVTSACPEQACLPVVAVTDQEAMIYALGTIGAVAPEECRLMRIANTRDLEWLYVSEALLPELSARCGIEVKTSPTAAEFDSEGMLMPDQMQLLCLACDNPFSRVT